MGQGNYDHPSYITRQQVALGKSVAGNAGTSCIKGFPNALRLRNVAAAVVTAGTSSGAGHGATLLCIGTCTQFATGTAVLGTGTTTLGSIALGTSAIGSVSTSGDLNVTLAPGSIICAKNGTDATGVYDLTGEAYLDPQATWTGNG